jgi:hypothetical protein
MVGCVMLFVEICIVYIDDAMHKID